MRIIDLIPVLSKRVVKYQLGQQFFPGFGKVNTGMRVQKFGRITFVFSQISSASMILTPLLFAL
jgi:hypothetical protein